MLMVKLRRHAIVLRMPAPRPLLGFWMCVALVVGNSIGSGVFLLPASLAPYGLNSVIAWGFTASGAIALAIVFARLSRAYPQAGGPYAYVHVAFGPLIAFIVAWGYWISIWVGNVALATAGVSYLSPLVPWIAEKPGASALVTVLLLWLLTFVNWYGIKASGLGAERHDGIKNSAAARGGRARACLRRARADRAAALQIPLSVSGVTAAATLTLWAMLGLESATIPADKVANPARTIPLVTLLGTIVTALICAVACTTVLLLVPPATLASSNAPFVDLANQFWGAWRRQTRCRVRRDQRVRRVERLDSAARRTAARHGDSRRLSAHFCA